MKYSPDYYAEQESCIPKGKLRTRFAPSPTGFMHLGGLRTALYAYLLAKKVDGTFLLRIEDTDQERFIPGAAELIYDTLKQAGIIYDEGPDVGGPVGPYIQSERREIYLAYIELLIARGGAYLCFCEKEVLDEQRNINRASRIAHKYDRRCMRLSKEEVAAKIAAGEPYVVRQKMPTEGTAFFDDLVYGRIEMENATLDDQVLLKRDGLPTYNFANVVDDHLMGITHIIRGNEFVPSTPKYILLYEAFGWTAPQFIHCAPIMRDATHKLSKRDGDAYFSDFVEKGYLIDAILNYIALLGWGPGGREEKFTLPELVEAFDIKGLSKDPSIFDYKKLHSLNGMYLRAMSEAEFHAAALPYIRQGVKREIDTAYVASVLKERCEVLSEIPEQLDFIDEQPVYSPALYDNKKMKTNPENAKAALIEIVPVLEGVKDWNPEVIQRELLALVERMGAKNGHILWPLRVALSGKMFTPGGGIELCVILGKDESIRRLRKAIETLDEFRAEQIEVAEVFVERAAIADEPAVEQAISAPEPTKDVPRPVVTAKEPAARRALTDPAELVRIAGLAKLNVDDKAEAYCEAIAPIMKVLDTLIDMELPTAGAFPFVEGVNLFREDVGRGPRSRADLLAERERLLAIAPAVEAGCISVPKVLGREE